MNVFACDADPCFAAQALADRHVVKMTVETAQIVSTVLHLQGRPGPYKPTHQRHPVVVAAAEDAAYLSWVVHHGAALAVEYQWRFGRVHGASAALETGRGALGLLQEPRLNGAPCAMPEDLRGPDPVRAYRAYLRTKYASWGAAARWTRRLPPVWLILLEVSDGDGAVVG